MSIPSAMSRGVPLAAVLLGERHDASVRSGAAAAAGVVEQHQGEQPVDLGVVHQGSQLPGQSDRLGREIDVAGVALVEDEVQHPHHRAHVAGYARHRPRLTVRLARLMRCAMVGSGTR